MAESGIASIIFGAAILLNIPPPRRWVIRPLPLLKTDELLKNVMAINNTKYSYTV
jgi:hypothetical protein